MSKNRSMLVIGGAGGMARWLTKNVFARESDLDITIVDVQADTAAVAKELGVAGYTVCEEDDDLVDIADPERFEVVLVGVPNDKVGKVANSVLPNLREGAFVFDICSVKREPIQCMVAASGGRLRLLGTHPLFGIQVSSLVGQNVILCRVQGKKWPEESWLREIFERNGAYITDSSAEEHDMMMSYVQTLTHFVYLGFAKTLQETDFPVDKCWSFSTPPFLPLVSFAGRILGGNPGLYADIQRKAMLPQVRSDFIKACSELDSVFRSPTATKTCIADEISGIVRAFPQDDVDNSIEISAVSIRNFQAFNNALFRASRTQEVVALEHRNPMSRTNRILVGKILRVEHDGIHFVDCTVRRDGGHEDGGRDPGCALIYDDDSKAAFARLGYQPKASKKPVRIHKRNLRLLPESELRKWKTDNLEHHGFDVSVELPQHLNPVFFERAIPCMLPDVLSAELRDEYALGGDRRRYLYSIRSMGDVPPEQVRARVFHVFKELFQDGGKRVRPSEPAVQPEQT